MGRETDQLRIHAAVYWVALYNIELLISLFIMLCAQCIESCKYAWVESRGNKHDIGINDASVFFSANKVGIDSQKRYLKQNYKRF